MVRLCATSHGGPRCGQGLASIGTPPCDTSVGKGGQSPVQRDRVLNSDAAAKVRSGRGAGDAHSLAERLTNVYWQRIRTSGIGPTRSRARRGELLERVAACMDHFRENDAALVAQITRALERYERLRAAAGIRSAAGRPITERSAPARGWATMRPLRSWRRSRN